MSRSTIKLVGLAASLLVAGCAGSHAKAEEARAAGPNVVLVMTDDQGIGDFGFAGNPAIRTPHLDRMFEESARLATFYVHPVCAPTRAALMTGRWPQRTSAIDTYVGRAMLEPEELTLAEVLRDAGWATGIFGKWHLGDCYPMRAMDQGFETSLVHRGGGIGQPSDPIGAEGDYTDAVLFRNGVAERTSGYCTDVYFREAIEWMAKRQAAGQPFFCYLPTNAPHGPFHDVPEELLAAYLAADLSPAAFPDGPGHALPERHNEERLAQIFAMITNVDENMGRLFRALDDMGAADDTLVLFLIDNGPNSRRFVGGFRGNKSSVYEGGVRSPLLARWPGRLSVGTQSALPAANVDLFPTILEACGVPEPIGVRDGRSLLPLLEGREADWPDRDLVIQGHRGDRPVRYRNFLLRTSRWKLVNPSGFGGEVEAVEPAFELYDLTSDPFEMADLAAAEPEVVNELSARYDAWFDDVTARSYDPPRIVLGPEAGVVHLTRQDWRRLAGGGWGKGGEWWVDVRGEEAFDLTVRLNGKDTARFARVVCGGYDERFAVTPEGGVFELRGIALPSGAGELRIELTDDEANVGPYQVVVRPAG